MRRTVEAVLYLVKSGCHWRLLPSDFPHWRTVYEYFATWRDNGVLTKIQRQLYFAVRQKAGRQPYPTVAIIDSQSTKTSKMGGVRGYDGGKHVKGRKRHLVVDSLGLPISVSITAANVHDQRGGRHVLRRTFRFLHGHPLKKLYGDGGYDGEPFSKWVRRKFHASIKIGGNLAQKLKRFVPVSQRWVVERSLAWIDDYRRLKIDYERTIASSRAMFNWAVVRLLLRKLFR